MEPMKGRRAPKARHPKPTNKKRLAGARSARRQERNGISGRTPRKKTTIILATLTILVIILLIPDLSAAASKWIRGQKLDEYKMWGVSFLWWARAGKMLQFTGGLVVVLDLIGPNRLRRLGMEARNNWQPKAFYRAKIARSAFNSMINNEYAPPSERKELSLKGFILIATSSCFLTVLMYCYWIPGGPYWILLPISCVANFLVIGISYALLRDAFIAKPGLEGRLGMICIPGSIAVSLGAAWLLPGPPALLLAPLNFFLSFVALFVILQVPILVSIWLFGKAAPFFLETIAKILDREQPGHPARLLAFALVVVGFSFDFLGS